jgi:hypothetical protein
MKMTARFLLIAVVATLASAVYAHAQGVAKKQVVISPSMLEVMSARKAKSKTPLMSRVGITRRPSVNSPTTTKSAVTQPTSVTALRSRPKK